MNKNKRKKIEAAGYKIQSVAEFLNLSQEESELIEIRRSLSQAIRTKRKREDITQEDLARMIASSQSRVARIEASDPSSSLDLLVRTFLALGSSKSELAGVISGK